VPSSARRRAAFPIAATLVAIAALALVAAPQAPAGASCTKFAAPGGSDSATGTEAAPFRSAQKLVNSLSAGDVGCLRAGTYSQGTLSFSRAGTSAAPITLTSYPGELATLSGVVYVRNGSDNVTISNLAIDGGSASSQITVQVMATGTVLDGNDITNRSLGESCMVLGSLAGYGKAVRTVVQNNRFHDCGNPADGAHDHAMYIESSDSARVVDNLIWGSAAWAVHLYPDAQGSYIAHNVMDRNGGGVIFAGEAAGGEYSQDHASSGNVVEKNVISNSTQTYNIESWWGGPRGTGNAARDNCVWGGRSGNISTSDGGFTSSGNLAVDPRYAGRLSNDFRLGSTQCLQVVGYDTAAKLSGGTSAPPLDTTPPPDTTPPSVAWVTPASGSTVFGLLSASASTCLVSATDNLAVAGVAFTVDGSPLGTDLGSPFGCDWDTRTASEGTHTLAARASDPAGNSALASTQVTVRNGTPVDTAPTVAVAAPADGATVMRTFGAAADASDDRAVAKVDFRLDGAMLSTDTTAPYSATVSIKSKNKLDRWHALTATAYDTAGLQANASSRVFVSALTTAGLRRAMRLRRGSQRTRWACRAAKRVTRLRRTGKLVQCRQILRLPRRHRKR
jgi:hypothetical protein